MSFSEHASHQEGNIRCSKPRHVVGYGVGNPVFIQQKTTRKQPLARAADRFTDRRRKNEKPKERDPA